MMQSFLSASNAGERSSKNQVVRTWVRQLRDLAFDVEDCVEFVVHLDEASHWDWVKRLTLPILVCTGRPPLPLDLAVAEIRRLKARVEDVSHRNTRYNLIASGDGGGDANSDQQLLTQTVVAGSASSAAATFHFLRKIWEDTGKLQDIGIASDLIRLIDCQGSELQVISLWGSQQADAVGELGWKAIVKKAYDESCTCQEFKSRAWIKLTHPFNPVEFLNTLLTHFTSTLHHHHHDMSKLVQQVSQHKYLIVLEQEISSVADWDAIRLCLPNGDKGSRIIVSTRNLQIALACTREPYQVWELRRFLHDQFLYAFFPKGSGHRSGIGELIWQLRRPGVISVVGDTSDQFIDNWKMQLHKANGEDGRVLDGAEFEYSCSFDATTRGDDQQFKLAELAEKILSSFYLEDEEHKMMSSEDKTEKCRELLTEHNWLIYIINLHSAEDWNLIRRDLLPESIRGCIVVITDVPKAAVYCADHKSRVLNADDLLRGHHEHGDSGGKITELSEYIKSVMVGRDHIYEKLTVFEGTLSVWGIAGVGKTAFVKKIYCKHKYYEGNERYEMWGWVDVPHPFSLTKLCWQLLLDLYYNDDETKEAAAIAMMEGQDPTRWCSKILRGKNILLVVDGLQSKHDWDRIKETLLSNCTGNTIVITRDESVARHCSVDHIINLKCLEDSAALVLFTKIAFDSDELPGGVENILKNIITQCGGFPEVITAIGRECRRDKSFLDDIHADFMGILERMPGLRGLFSWMHSYFDTCSDEVKPCIFYLLVFPPEESIRRRRLLRRWIAESYSSGGGAGTLEEKAEKLFSELMELSILHQEKKTTKVNGFFREYIKSRPFGDNLVFALEGSSSPSSRLTGQHLTISRSWERDEVVFNSLDLSRLRSLSVFGPWRSFLASEKMKLLRVLDLEGTNSVDATSVTDDQLEQIAKLLHRLKFLSLRRCHHITRLPDSLGDMRPLQTLDIRYTSIVELSSTIITKLHKLQYIRAGTSTNTGLILVQKKTPPPPPPSPPQQDSHGGTSPLLQAKAAARVVQGAWIRTTVGWKQRARDLVESSRNSYWQLKHKQSLESRQRLYANGGGVEIFGTAAEGIGSLTDMHTLGVVNVAGGKGALLFLDELKKLTQLRKLGLSGINSGNWDRFCSAISGNLHHLESLSVQLLEDASGSFDFASFDKIREPPKTIKSLKVLYSNTEGRTASIRPTWIYELDNLEKFDHELTISSQDDIFALEAQSSRRLSGWRFRIKPIEEHLSFEYYGPATLGSRYKVVGALRIECSGTLSQVTVTLGDVVIFDDVTTLSVHCCCTAGSPSCGLKVAGLEFLFTLKEVTVTGPCSDDLKRALREQVNNHNCKPALN